MDEKAYADSAIRSAYIFTMGLNESNAKHWKITFLCEDGPRGCDECCATEQAVAERWDLAPTQWKG